jgi:hypothetical protein
MCFAVRDIPSRAGGDYTRLGNICFVIIKVNDSALCYIVTSQKVLKKKKMCRKISIIELMLAGETVAHLCMKSNPSK